MRWWDQKGIDWEKAKARRAETESESETDMEEEEARSTASRGSGSSGAEWSGAVSTSGMLNKLVKYYIRTELSDWVAAVLGLD